MFNSKLLTTCLIVCWLCVSVEVAFAHGQGGLPPKDSPLQVDYGNGLHYLDVGYVYEQEVRPASFKVVNVSSTPQTVIAVEPTCDCTRQLTTVDNVVLQPGEALTVEFEILAARMLTKKFARFFVVKSMDAPLFHAQYKGEVRDVATVTPEREVELPMQKTPDVPWEVNFELKRVPELEKVVLGPPPESPYFAYDFQDLGEGNYTLKVTPKADLPYSRKFSQKIRVPVLEPATAKCIALNITVPVAEQVVFTPDRWTIARSALEAAGSLTAHFAYGVVPGLQEDEKISTKDMMRPRKMRQKNAIPLKFVREHHDWDDLFAHLEFRMPEGVKLEKLRHPTGIELQITVTPESFAEAKQLVVMPFRGVNDCLPITIELVEE
ncbi:MAG: DUF1573 domain-containing protein [Victivallales bacterium]|nr:DUF1573 domain-containing protein [Victivallales bacterium]